MLKKLKSLFGASSKPVIASSSSDADRQLLCGLAAIIAGVVNGRDEFTLEEMLPTIRKHLAEYLMQAILEGSDTALALTAQLTEMGVFDEVDEVPPSDGLRGGDVPG